MEFRRRTLIERSESQDRALAELQLINIHGRDLCPHDEQARLNTGCGAHCRIVCSAARCAPFVGRGQSSPPILVWHLAVRPEVAGNLGVTVAASRLSSWKGPVCIILDQPKSPQLSSRRSE